MSITCNFWKPAKNLLHLSFNSPKKSACNWGSNTHTHSLAHTYIKLCNFDYALVHCFVAMWMFFLMCGNNHQYWDWLKKREKKWFGTWVRPTDTMHMIVLVFTTGCETATQVYDNVCVYGCQYGSLKMYLLKCMHPQTNTNTCMHTHTHTHAHTHTHSCMHAHTHILARMHTAHTYIHTYTPTHTSTHTHTHTYPHPNPYSTSNSSAADYTYIIGLQLSPGHSAPLSHSHTHTHTQTPSTGLRHLPSTTAVFSYATGSRKLSANEQFFCWSSNSSKSVTNNSKYIRHLFHNWPCCLC